MTVLALHGFTQRGSMWDEVAELEGGDWRAPDLPGHGDAPVDTWEGTVASLADELASLERPRVLVGYSMGGRIALGVVLHRPELVDALVIISAAPGIRSSADREDRQRSDERRATRIAAIGVEQFVSEWVAQPLFASMAVRSADWRAADLAMRASNTAEGLAGALRQLGQGVMPWMGREIRDIVAPAMFVAGARDRRYLATARRMAKAAPRGREWVASAAGHAVVAEDPRAVATAIALARRTLG